MEIELAEQPTPLEKGPIETIQRRFAKDEAILARFGKRQQLRVSLLICANLATSLARESLYWGLCLLILGRREGLGCYQSLVSLAP